MTIGERIKDLKGTLSQKDFAEKIGAGSSAVCAWENDESLPGSKYLEAIHQVFGVDINWLLTGVGEVYIYKEEKGLKINEPAVEYSTKSSAVHEQIKISDALAMAARVLESQTSYATALYLNIQHFDRAIQAEQRIANLEARLKLVENQLTFFSEREGREQKPEEAIQEEKTVGVQE